MDAPLSVVDIARRLRLAERTARRLIVSGELKGHRVGRQWRVFEPDFVDYLGRVASRRPVAAEVGSAV